MECLCGRELKKKNNSLTTKYKGKEFIIHNVPVYSCSEDHYRFTIGTRKRIKLLLKYAYENNLNEIRYDD